MQLRFLEPILFPSVRLNTEQIRKAVEGKTIVITGATSGIGEQLARDLSQHSVNLVLTGRNARKLEELKGSLQANATNVYTYTADLRTEAEREGFLTFLDSFKAIDLFVSNAGLSIHRPVLQSLDRLHDFERTMAINYFAPVGILLHILPKLHVSKGQIINVSTINMLLPPMKHWSAYQASKAAMDTWMRSLSPELKTVAISTLYLPLVRTSMIEPTKAYANMPALTKVQASKLIQKLMYTRKRQIRPWWLFWAGGIR